MSTEVVSETQAVPRVTLRTDSLSDTVLILLSLTIVQRLVGFCRSVLFCRWLDPEQLGEWDMAWGFLILAAPAAVLGLPGSFGRYVEHYRQRGDLRSFLRNTGLLTAMLTLLAVVAIGGLSSWFSQLIFGRDDCTDLVKLLAAALALVVAYNTLCELFTALRLTRVVSTLQFVHSLLFAVLGAGLLFCWRTTAEGVAAAYALACLLCLPIAMIWLRSVWRDLPSANARLSHSAVLTKIMPFAVWVWVINWLFNLFDIISRYMIVHHSGLNAAEALVQVGNYHSARVVPLLLVSMAGLLATAALPHLSHDWERGNRAAVSRQVNFMFKLVLFGLMAGGTIILLATPLLFDSAFGGKYAGGRAALPFALAGCVWFGVIGVAQNYLWCAERVRLGSLAILAGVLLNIGLNLVLLPRFGLIGAMSASAAANLATLLLTYLLGTRCGLKLDPAVAVFVALPPLFCAGPWLVLTALCGLTVWAVQGSFLLNHEEKHQLRTVVFGYLTRLRGMKPAING